MASLTTQIHAPSGVCLYLYWVCICGVCGVYLVCICGVLVSVSVSGVYWVCICGVCGMYLVCICGVSGISLVHNCDANRCPFYAFCIFRSVSMPGLDMYHMILSPAQDRV